MPSLRPMSNKVGVPNAYFMLPPAITAEPLKPREGRVRKLRQEEVSSYEHLGFHHLVTLLAWALGLVGRLWRLHSLCFEWKGWREKRKSSKICWAQIVFDGRWRAVDPLWILLGPYIGRGNMGQSKRQGCWVG
jgi:hypothetical protein